MQLPGGADALVDRDKLIGYCLNPDHRHGKQEARVFATALGFFRADAEALRATLLAGASYGWTTSLFCTITLKDR